MRHVSETDKLDTILIRWATIAITCCSKLSQELSRLLHTHTHPRTCPPISLGHACRPCRKRHFAICLLFIVTKKQRQDPSVKQMRGGGVKRGIRASINTRASHTLSDHPSRDRIHRQPHEHVPGPGREEAESQDLLCEGGGPYLIILVHCISLGCPVLSQATLPRERPLSPFEACATRLPVGEVTEKGVVAACLHFRPAISVRAAVSILSFFAFPRLS